MNQQTVMIEQVNEMGPGEVARDSFTYPLEFMDLQPGETQTKTFTIQADSAFFVHNQVQFTDTGSPQDASSREIPVCKIMITDTGTGRQLYAEAVSLASQFGTAELPYILPRPKYFLSRATVEVSITNISSGTTYPRIMLAFNGEKIYFKGI